MWKKSYFNEKWFGVVIEIQMIFFIFICIHIHIFKREVRNVVSSYENIMLYYIKASFIVVYIYIYMFISSVCVCIDEFVLKSVVKNMTSCCTDDKEEMLFFYTSRI